MHPGPTQTHLHPQIHARRNNSAYHRFFFFFLLGMRLLRLLVCQIRACRGQTRFFHTASQYCASPSTLSSTLPACSTSRRGGLMLPAQRCCHVRPRLPLGGTNNCPPHRHTHHRTSCFAGPGRQQGQRRGCYSHTSQSSLRIGRDMLMMQRCWPGRCTARRRAGPWARQRSWMRCTSCRSLHSCHSPSTRSAVQS